MTDHRSHSQLSAYLRCSEAYRLQRLDRAPERPAAWLIQGTAFHAAIEAYEASGRQLTEAEAVQHYTAAYDSEVNTELETHPLETWLTGGRVKPGDDLANRRQRGSDQVTAYIRWAPSQPFKLWELPDGSPAVEVPFHLWLDGLEIRGMIDQIVEYQDGTILVRDLKAGNRLPDSSLQLGVYDLAFESMFGFRTNLGDYYMAKNTAPTMPYGLAHWTEGIITRAFHNVDKAIRAKIFIPNVGDSCGICSVRQYCSALGDRTADFPPRPIAREDF